MTTRYAQRLVRTAEEASRFAHLEWINAELAMNQYESPELFASLAGQQAEGRRNFLKSLADNARVNVILACDAVKRARVREDKIGAWIGSVIAGLVCAFLFPLFGATTLPEGLLDYGFVVLGYGASMYLLYLIRLPYEELELFSCKRFLFAASVFSFLGLPLMAVAVLFLTNTIGIVNFPIMCAGIIASAFAFYLLPRLVTPYI